VDNASNCRGTLGIVCFLSIKSLLNCLARSIATDQVRLISREYVSILVIRSRATLPVHLPSAGTLSFHHVHAVLLDVGLLAADVVLPVPVQDALGPLPVMPTSFPFARIIYVA